MPSFSLVGAVEFRQLVASLRSQAASSSLGVFDSPVSPYAGGHYHTPRHRSRSSSVSPNPRSDSEQWDSVSVPLNDRSPELLCTTISEEPSGEEEGTRTPLTIPTIPSVTHSPVSLAEAPTLTEVEEHVPPPPQSEGLRSILEQTWHILFPSLQHFKSKTLTGKIVSLLAAPAVMALTITLPVVITPFGNDGSHEEKIDRHDTRLPEFEEEGVERVLMVEHEVEEELRVVGFNKWLTAVQCVLGPLLCVTAVFSTSVSSCDLGNSLTLSQDGESYLPWVLAGTALGGFVFALLVLAFAKLGAHPVAQLARCSMGFIVSVVWIMLIADEVVNVLQVTDFDASIRFVLTRLLFRPLGSSLGSRMRSSVSRSSPLVTRSPISSPTRAWPYVPCMYTHSFSSPLLAGLCPRHGLLRLLRRPDGQHPPRHRHLRHLRHQRRRRCALRPALHAHVDHEHGRAAHAAVDDAGGSADEWVRAVPPMGHVFDRGVCGVDECERGGGGEF